MKKLIALSIFAVALASCEKQEIHTPDDGHDHEAEVRSLSTQATSYYSHVEESTYEGCEYIAVGPVAHRWGSHKGNCKNPMHRMESKKALRDSIQALQLYIKELEQENHILTSALAQRDYDKHNK